MTSHRSFYQTMTNFCDTITIKAHDRKTHDTQTHLLYSCLSARVCHHHRRFTEAQSLVRPDYHGLVDDHDTVHIHLHDEEAITPAAAAALV